jgi:hypothetical protein
VIEWENDYAAIAGFFKVDPATLTLPQYLTLRRSLPHAQPADSADAAYEAMKADAHSIVQAKVRGR